MSGTKTDSDISPILALIFTGGGVKGEIWPILPVGLMLILLRREVSHPTV